MSAVTAKVTGVTPIGAGKVANIGFEVNGAVQTRKAWATEKDGSPTWVPGQTYQVEFFEQENTYNGNTKMEQWAKKAQAPTPNGGGRGAPKVDPDKLAVERDKVELEREKQQQFERKWEIDRQSDKWKSCSIVAQVAAKIAQEISVTELTTIGGEFDSAKFKSYVSDIAKAIDSTTTELYAFNQAPVAGGGGQ